LHLPPKKAADVVTSRPAEQEFVIQAKTEPLLEVSVVVPIYNEVESVPELYRRLTEVLAPRYRYEIILVDDGSTDGTYPALCRLAAEDSRVKVIQFRRNFGQTAAMAAGFDHAGGEIIIPMDADLQNDPADIPNLVSKMAEGYDVVSGWRKNRQDKALVRKFPSRIANRLISAVTGVKLHDYGCSLKAYRAEVLKDVRLYGEMHRFIPALASHMGARVCEIPVNHYARKYGHSKYGLKRTFKVLIDLLMIKVSCGYATKPHYFFALVGALLCFGGVASGAWTLVNKYVDGVLVHQNPLILLAVFLFLVGAQMILMGLLAQMVMCTYHESQSKPIYCVRNRCNL
jgi:glycosyltransferase involved in cell wall biosynthesis